jgi:hypothetical protein
MMEILMIQARAQAFAQVLTALSPILSRIPNEVSYDETKGFQLKLNGFYKEGNITLRVVDAPKLQIVIEGRYSVLDQVFNIDELLDRVVAVQIERYRHYSVVKPETAAEIDRNWLPILIDMGKVEKKVVETYHLA